MKKTALLIGILPSLFLAANKGGGEGSGGGTATGTGTGAKTTTKEKPEVKVHTKLADLLKKYDAAAEKTASFMIEIAEMVEKENISNAQLIKTIVDVRGVEESTAKGQASRIRTLIKDADQLEALRRGEVTVRAAVKAAQKTRKPSAASKQKAFDNRLAGFVEAAKALGQPKATILATVEAKLDEAKIK